MSEFPRVRETRQPGRSELQLACEAVKAALDDVGLGPTDVDGLVTFTLDTNEEAVEPVLRLLDCCQESDGGVALVVSTPERVRDLRQLSRLSFVGRRRTSCLPPRPSR